MTLPTERVIYGDDDRVAAILFSDLFMVVVS